MPMLTFSHLGNWGRLGNQLFQYASMIGLADKYTHELKLPAWPYAKYFSAKFPEGNVMGFEYQEPTFHYEGEIWDCLEDRKTTYDLKGYFQSEKYWQHCEGKVRAQMQWNEDFRQQVIEPFSHALTKQTIAISIRRGDYIDNPNYHLLPISYYINALFDEFPDWQDYNLIIFSDDIPWCRVHFGCLENVYFSENNSDIEDICLMSQCNHFIISNSTFSWWGAYLGEKKGTKVVRPVHHFEGRLKERNNIKDFYPELWVAFDYSGKKINLKDVTFTIPVYMDHSDRRQNLELSVCMLQHSFQTKIIVCENKSRELSHMIAYTDFYQTDHAVFHRTKMLNDMAELATTEIIVNWDADIILPPMQLWKAIQEVRNGADMVYPYDGRFARIPREVWFRKLQHRLDVGIIGDTRFNGMNASDNQQSVGGAVIWRKSSYIAAGGENENFISFGAEDTERFIRSNKLGLNVKRVPGCLYHINHWVGVNSSTRNPYFMQNRREFEKVDSMTKEELQEYISTWEWKNITC